MKRLLGALLGFTLMYDAGEHALLVQHYTSLDKCLVTVRKQNDPFSGMGWFFCIPDNNEELPK